jgi:cysteine synthase
MRPGLHHGFCAPPLLHDALLRILGTSFPEAGLRDELLGRPTPLLRFRGALLKLESMRPSGEADDRALSLFPALTRGASASFAGTAGAAIAAAGWARTRGVRLFVALHGVATYEARETLRLLGAGFEVCSSAADAGALLAARGGTLLPALDGDDAVAAIERSLGPELRDAGDVRAVIAPAGARAALLAAVRALPGSRGIALLAADDELPGLPRDADLPASVERRPVSRALCVRARAGLARETGVLGSHASAMAAFLAAAEGGLVLLSTGEREFSLEGSA